jgi:uncharacterized protein YdeI (YjbR/CyaY-like superfamily)
MPEEGAPEVPAVLADALGARAKAGPAFEALPPGQRRLCVKWVMDAKREETRRKRAAKVARTLAAGKRLGLK